MVTNRDTLLQSCSDLKDKLLSEQNTLNQIDQGFHALYSTFNSSVTSTVDQAHQKLQNFTQDSPLLKNVQQFMASVNDQKVILQDQIATLERSNQFRDQYKDALVIYVFGKVKTGKSSLGNYIAYGIPNPSAEEQAKLKNLPNAPVYHTLAVNQSTGRLDNAEELAHFKVGVTETTSTIQSFSLPGLTWVDSPGVHSITQTNEALAKSYLNHADLILYTESSDNPGRSSDSEEILDIVSKGYHPIVLINKSDSVTQDFDENDNLIKVQVPKSPETRRLQEESTLDNIKETAASYTQDPERHLSAAAKENINNLLSSIKLMSLSTGCAYLAKDNEQFKASGVSDFLQVLNDTVSSDGVKLKREAPLNQYQGFLEEIKKTMLGFDQQLTSLQKMCTNNRSRLQISLQQEIALGQSNLSAFMEQTFQSLEQERDSLGMQADATNSNFQHKIEQVIGIIEQETQRLGGQAIVNVVSSLMQDFDEQKIHLNIKRPNNLPTFKIDERTETFVTSYRPPKRGKRGFWGGLIGGTVGFLVGGPVGAGIGAGLGVATGSATAGGGTYSSTTKTFKLGDNYQEIKMACRQNIMDEFEREVEDNARQMFNEMFSQFEEVLGQLRSIISTANQDIKQLQSQIAQLRQGIEG